MAQKRKMVWNKRRLIWQASIGLFLILLTLGAAWYLTSEHFVNYVRGRIVTKLEDATGGRVELKSLRWNLSQLTFNLDDLTIHGLEPANEIPYAHADHIAAQVTVLSWWRRDFNLRLLRVEHPVLHLIVNPDGSTNQPTPKVRAKKAGKNGVESLLDLAIGRAEVRDGMLLVNDKPTPLDFSANEVSATLTYDKPGQRYDVAAHVGKLDAKIEDMRPVAATVDAQVALYQKRAEIKSLTISTGRSRMEASGEVQDFNSPRVTLAYKARVDVAEVGGITRNPELRAGIADLDGRAEYAAGTYTSRGKLTTKGFEYVTGTARLPNVAASGNYTVDAKKLVIPDLVARALGGTVTGAVEVTNWAEAQRPEKIAKARRENPPRDSEQVGEARLKVAGVQVGEVAQMLSSKTLPLNKMGFAGTANGTVLAKWRGPSRNVVVEIASEATPPAQASPGQLPVTATMRGTYYNGRDRLDVSQLVVRTPASELVASGTLGTEAVNAAAKLRVALTTTNLDELKPVLSALERSTEFPIALRGNASFNGTAQGTLKSLALAGDVRVSDFDLLTPAGGWKATAAPIPTQRSPLRRAQARTNSVVMTGARVPPQPAGVPAIRTHWDSFTGYVQYSPKLVAVKNGVLRERGSQVDIDGSAELTNGDFTDASRFVVKTRLRDVPSSVIAVISGRTLPGSATVNFDGQVNGSVNDTQASGRVVLKNVTAYGESFREAAANVQFADQEARLTNIDLAHNGGRVTGTAAYNLKTERFAFNLSGTALQLGAIQNLQARMPVQGVANFTVNGSGTKDAPELNGKATVRNILARGEGLGDLTAEAVTTGDTMRVTARSDVQHSDVDVNATVRLRGDFPAEFRANIRHLDFDPLLRSYVRGKLTSHSNIAGTITGSGPLRNPRAFAMQAQITRLAIDAEHVPIRNEGPVEISLRNQVATIQRLRVTGPETDFTVSGTVALTGTQALDVRSEGHVSLKLLQSMNPDFASYGMLNVTAHVSGTLAEPNVFGRIQIANGGINYIDLPNGLSEMNGTIVFNKNRAQLSDFTARTGGGTLQIGGFITYGKSVVFNLDARARDFRLRYPAGVSALADADLRLNGTPKSALLSGDVTVTRFGLNPRFDFATYLARGKQPMETPGPNSPLNNLKLDVHVVSTPQLQVQTSLAKISGNADLHIRGTAARPAILGRVSIIEGDIFLNGTKYQLERGDVTFTNPVRIEPNVDIEARTMVRNYDISLGFHGPLDKLSTTYRSDPPLAANDIMFLLAFGRTREDSAVGNTQQLNVTESASNEILSQALNAAVSSRVQKLFGVTRVKIDPRVGGAENNSGTARITVEQQVANNVAVTYITDLTRSTQQIIQVEYNINKNVSVVAVRNEYGVVSLDLRLRQRKR